MKNRKVAILHTDDTYSENLRNIVSALDGFADDITVFIGNGITVPDFVKSVTVPVDAGTGPKRRNWINSEYRNAGFNGFLYVVNSSVEILNDPAKFATDLERMMKLFDYSVWFSTVTDGCNYVYSKYNPRMSVDLDRPDVLERTGLSGKIHFTSHSNTQVVVYDFSAVSDDMLKFNEQFTVSMFWIIEFLARRRNNNPGSLFFMNQYMTVESEASAFRNLPVKQNTQESPEQMKLEDVIFKSLNINFASDNNIDIILERFWEKIKEKTGIQG